MTENKYEVTAWGSGPRPFDIELPSGQLCLVKPLEMPDIIRLGIINQLDGFSALLVGEDDSKPKKVKDHQKTKKQIKREEEARILGVLSTGDNFETMMNTMETVVLECVLKPQIVADPEDPEDMIEGVPYIANVSFNDQMHIFNEVFQGLGGMEKFRSGQEASVGDVEEE